MRDEKTLNAIAATLVLVAASVLAACEPADRRPGTWLSGEVAPPPSDWAFTDAHMEIFVETRPWYGIPHSVTTVVAARGDDLYVPSIYDADVPFPGSKRWNANIAANPEVRLKIGDKLYEMTATPVLDDDEYQIGFKALADKYPFWRTALEDPSKRPSFAIIRMNARSVSG